MSTPTSSPSSPFLSPTFMAVVCYTIWGVVPLFYLPIHAFGGGAIEIIAHRSVWAMLWAGGLVWATKQWPAVGAALKTPYLRWMLLLTSLLVASNWGVYVWAVTNGHTIESSLGYYLTPLINMACGAIFFRERFDRWAITAIALAVVGVLILAGTFGTYGVLRKHLPITALPGLFIECAYLFVPAILYLIWFEGTHQGHFFVPSHAFWFLLTGPVTVLPLALFGYAAKRLPLSTLGFVQFIGPTLTFFIGVDEGESFTWLRGASFAFIWLGALVFAYGAWRRSRAMKVAEAA